MISSVDRGRLGGARAVPLVAPPVRGFALISFPQLGDEHVAGPPLHLRGNQTSGAPRHRRDVVSVATSARWRGGT